MRIRRLDPIAAILWIAAVAACSPVPDTVPETAGGAASETMQESAAVAESTPVLREILARMPNPPGAPGYDLTLVRYTIAPGAELPPHIHPGVQLAHIVSGTLSYRVIAGTAEIHRGVDAMGVPASVERVTGPADTQLGPGDAIAEVAELHHFGANRTSEPVVILAALVTEAGAELAVPRELPAGE